MQGGPSCALGRFSRIVHRQDPRRVRSAFHVRCRRQRQMPIERSAFAKRPRQSLPGGHPGFLRDGWGCASRRRSRGAGGARDTDDGSPFRANTPRCASAALRRVCALGSAHVLCEHGRRRANGARADRSRSEGAPGQEGDALQRRSCRRRGCGTSHEASSVSWSRMDRAASFPS